LEYKLASPSLRKLVFTVQPTDTVDGRISGLKIGVTDEQGNPDTAFNGPISLVIENAPVPPGEATSAKGTPKRIRASSPGCEDAISNVFYILPKQ
jgi:hypothetical protein